MLMHVSVRLYYNSYSGHLTLSRPSTTQCHAVSPQPELPMEASPQPEPPKALKKRKRGSGDEATKGVK